MKLMKHRTRISFWATKCSQEFLDKRAERIYKKLLKLEEDLQKIREEIFDEFTKPKKVEFRKK